MLGRPRSHGRLDGTGFEPYRWRPLLIPAEREETAITTTRMGPRVLLTEYWTDAIRTDSGMYVLVEREPLILTLWCTIGSSNDHGGIGRRGPRIPVNLSALDVYSLIDATARSELCKLTARPDPGDPIVLTVQRLADTAAALYHRLVIPEAEHTRIGDMLDGWVRMIESLIDPPTIREILAPCPYCGHRYQQAPVTDPVVGTDTFCATGSAALIATYTTGHTPVAFCRECGHTWEGERELLTLGYHARAEMDTETLTALGLTPN